MDDRNEIRLSALESWRTSVEVSLGKHEVDRDYIKKEFDTMREELKEIKNSAKKLNYTIYAAVIVYVINFALNGGLAAHIAHTF